MSITVLKQALEALEDISSFQNHTNGESSDVDKAITSLRQAIAEAEKQQQDDKMLEQARTYGDAQRLKFVNELAEGKWERWDGKSAALVCKFFGQMWVHAKEKSAVKESLTTQQEPVAIPQFRIQGCSDWYDGYPDYLDEGGVYETRTLYTSPPQCQWVGLSDEDVEMIVENRRAAHWEFVRQVEAKLKEKNT